MTIKAGHSMSRMEEKIYLKPCAQKGIRSGPEVISFFMLNSAEHEHFYANKYENANANCCQGKFARMCNFIWSFVGEHCR